MFHILVNIKTNLHKHPDLTFQIRPGQGYFSNTGKTYTSIPALLFKSDQGRDILVEPRSHLLLGSGST